VHLARTYCPDFRRTLTGNEQLAWLRAPSEALHWTIVVPGGKKLPDGGSQTTDGDTSRSSLAVTVKVTISPGGPERGLATVEHGQGIDRGEARMDAGPRLDRSPPGLPSFLPSK